MNPLLYFRRRKPTVLTQMIFDKIFQSRLSSFKNISGLFKDRDGIEIGGPSRFFSEKGFIPLYSLANKIDGCNFSNQTTWEGSISEGETYLYAPGKCGNQFICEGADVTAIPKNRYDFVLSCNNLEHIANPLKAINNWLKLLKDRGTIVLVLPRKESNFDHKRHVNSFEHLLEDYVNKVGEDDLTHLNEILKLHDLKYDPLAGSYDNFKKRATDNYNNRCLHQHVYDLDLLEQVCGFFDLKLIVKESLATDHVIVAEKYVAS